jgi:S-adenosylmethionine hydrolase
VAATYDLVTFITDYGQEGGFVGMLHAVVESMTKTTASLIDIDHSIPPQDVLLGAVRLERAMAYTRPGVHVAVIDPGVGGKRRAVGLEAGGRVFIGPDNGLLVPAAVAVGGVERAVSLERHLPSHRARTFDGRDVFAPAAGLVATGMDLGELGPAISPAELVPLEVPQPRFREDGGFEVTVLQVDGFGNVQFCYEDPQLSELGDQVRLTRPDGGPEALVAVARTFSEVPVGSPLVLEDSDGCLALSVNRGRADELLKLAPGDKVLVAPVA